MATKKEAAHNREVYNDIIDTFIWAIGDLQDVLEIWTEANMGHRPTAQEREAISTAHGAAREALGRLIL